MTQKQGEQARIRRQISDTGISYLSVLQREGDRISNGVATHQVASGTLLVRDAEGTFSFIHQSVFWASAEHRGP